MLDISLGILLDFKYKKHLTLYPGDTEVLAHIIAYSSRAVNFREEIGRPLPLTVELTNIMPEAGPIKESKIINIEKLSKGENLVFVLDFTIPKARVVNITASIPYMPEFGMSYVGTVAHAKLDIRPHFIVEHYVLETPVVKTGDYIKVRIKAWSNVYPDEQAYLMSFFTLQDKTFSGSSMPFGPGEKEYLLMAKVPDISFQPWEEYKELNLTIFVSAIPDILPGDNIVKSNILIYNPSYNPYWWMILIVMIIILILVVIVLVKFLRRNKHLETEYAVYSFI